MRIHGTEKQMFSGWQFLRYYLSVLRIPDPDTALNFPSSGSGSWKKFRIHADPGPTYIDLVPVP